MIVTPLDSAVLDSKEQYVFYHKMVDFALKELIVAVQQKQITLVIYRPPNHECSFCHDKPSEVLNDQSRLPQKMRIKEIWNLEVMPHPDLS